MSDPDNQEVKSIINNLQAGRGTRKCHGSKNEPKEPEKRSKPPVKSRKSGKLNQLISNGKGSLIFQQGVWRSAPGRFSSKSSVINVSAIGLFTHRLLAHAFGASATLDAIPPLEFQI